MINRMAHSAEESSASYSESCFICEECFSTDGKLAAHLLEHAKEEKYQKRLAELEAQDGEQFQTPPRRPIQNRNVPEFIRTSFVTEPPLRKKPDLTPTEPEVWEIVSDDDEPNDNQGSNPNKKVKTASGFRLISSASAGSSKSSTSDTGPPYHCHQCKSVFTEAIAFREHLLTHDKPRPYVCHICKKSFAYKGTLRQHLHLHISDRSHECPICHKKFSIKSVLKKHVESHDLQQLQQLRNNST